MPNIRWEQLTDPAMLNALGILSVFLLELGVLVSSPATVFILKVLILLGIVGSVTFIGRKLFGLRPRDIL